MFHVQLAYESEEVLRVLAAAPLQFELVGEICEGQPAAPRQPAGRAHSHAGMSPPRIGLQLAYHPF